MQKATQADFVIIGGGIIGLCIAKSLVEKFPQKSIVVLEKEDALGYHASGRNSGVLHAGFYYSADSLKAKFTLQGNREWKKFCHDNNLPLNENGKVVVAANESEQEDIKTLYQRGIKNNIPLQLINEKELAEIEPNAKTSGIALYSPETATIDPALIVNALAVELRAKGVKICTGEGFAKKLSSNTILTTKQQIFEADKIINTAGLYADHIAKQYGAGLNYTIIPFKGLYLKYAGALPPVKVNIYPVPDLSLPFLGVHFTVTVNHEVKIGPTAIPAFWRENYDGFSNFTASELVQVIGHQAKLFIQNRFNFRQHALSEVKKFYRPYFIGRAKHLVKSLDVSGFKHWTQPGIRAQLLDITKGQLVNDFIVESTSNSVHILNAVSPAFTCALPFSRWVVENYL